MITSKSLLKDLRQRSPDSQMYALESFHSVLNDFAPKWAAFHPKGILARYENVEITQEKIFRCYIMTKYERATYVCDVHFGILLTI